MKEHDLIFLGRGWAFPTGFNYSEGTTQMVQELEDIEQSLYLLLSTIPGERLMRPEYGCDLYSLVFENFDTTIQTQAKDMIEQAILHYEPRIIVEQTTVKVDIMESIAYIDIYYLIPKVNSRHNLVFPFYLKEGTNLSSNDF